MSLDHWVFTSEQLNISSIRKMAQHKAEDGSLLLLPGKAQQLPWRLCPSSQWKKCTLYTCSSSKLYEEVESQLLH